ncbi:MAG: hypothetical protein MR410_03815, partial [Eubacterium sp.]|nr:hypothetical protein [Eubacterium sp.]
NTLETGQDFDDLMESYVIFITRDDVLGFGLPIYHVNRVLEENGENFQDGSHIIYVNSKIQDDTELGRLMHDFHCKNAEDMYNSILAERVRELKETSEGVEYMCAAMDQIYQEGMEVGEAKGMKKGMEKGELKAKKETVISLAEMGLSAEKIAQVVKLQIQLVQEWITEGLNLAK